MRQKTTEAAIEEQIARRALAATYDDPRTTRLVRDAAHFQTRKALLAYTLAFSPGLPPTRPVDPALQAQFFAIPGVADPQTPATPLRTSENPPRTPQERRRYSAEFWSKVFAESKLTLEDLHPYRVRVFYRLVRELARLYDLVQSDELLEEMLHDTAGNDPWQTPRTPPKTSPRARNVLEALRQSPPLALLPPKAPFPLASGYDPLEDKALVSYVAALGLLADYLGIHNGTKKEPHLGRYGLQGLLDPVTTRLAAPAPADLMAWERQLVADTVRAVIRGGAQGAAGWLRSAHGLDHLEASDLIRMAKRQAKQTTLGSEVEEDRAIMVLRLEDLAARAKTGLSPAIELGALKQLSIVQGFGRIEPEDAVSEFVSVVKRVNQESPSPRIKKAEFKQLPNNDED